MQKDTSMMLRLSVGKNLLHVVLLHLLTRLTCTRMNFISPDDALDRSSRG